jgi:NAD(P)-dependent dehydrogenase (short-subunit alcohol dehydrogenase family)
MGYDKKHIAVFGASGAIGAAMVNQLIEAEALVSAFSRKPLTLAADTQAHLTTQAIVDITDETSLAAAADALATRPPLDGIIVATGLLHEGEGLHPEKSIRKLSAAHFERVLSVNTVGPALVARFFIPLLQRQSPVWFAALSARVGSISDNRLGGWYAYRASKAALNMVIRNLSIEVSRRNKTAIIVGLHPGTVDSALSKPFQSQVKPGKLFSPEHSAECLLRVLLTLTPADSGGCFAWDGQRIPE